MKTCRRLLAFASGALLIFFFTALPVLAAALASGEAERWKQSVASCMAEYDLDGWSVPDLINPDDVSVLRR